MRLRENWRSASALATFLPRIRPATKPSFCGDTRSMREIAFASLSLSTRALAGLPIVRPLARLHRGRGCGRSRRRCGRGRGARRRSWRRCGAFLLGRAIADRRVALEDARRRELAELVPDHVLGDVDRNVLVAVVDAERQPDELRQDGRSPAPDLDHFRTAGRARGIRLLQQITVDKRAFPYRAGHSLAPQTFCFLACRLDTMNLLVRLFLRVFLPLVGKPQGETGWRPPEVRPSPPPWGWSIGFIVTPRLCGMRPIQRMRPALPIETFIVSGLDTAPRVATPRPC